MLSAYDEFTVLHVGVNGAEDIAVHPEASDVVRHKRDCVLLSGCEAEPPVIVMDDCKSMYLAAVVVHDCNDYCVPLMHSNYRPLSPEGFVIATVHACEWVRRIGLYNGKMEHLTARR